MVTKLLYMRDFGVEVCEARVLEINQAEDGRAELVLDQTCFYARGGGQDWDTGVISTEDGNWKMEVDEVRLDELGTVHHIGKGNLVAGSRVRCVVDKARRSINTRLHSAGHALDMAMAEIKPDLTPGKGAHYPHMSFVEYFGTVEDTEHFTKSLQAKINTILSMPINNRQRFVNKEELEQLCRHVPENLPSNKPIRVVMYGDFGVPCGGTHVQNIQDIGKIGVTKIKSKKGIIKVSYRVEGIN